MKNTIPPLILFLLFAVACNSSHNHDQQQQPVSSAYSQLTPTGDTQLDSLLQLATTMPQDTNLAMLYFQIGHRYFSHDFEQAKRYYRKLGQLSEQLNWFYGRCLFATAYANTLTRQKSTDSSLLVLQEGLALAVNKNDEVWIANLNLNTGIAYSLKDWFETALSYLTQALSFYEQWTNKSKLQQTYNAISQIYIELNAMDKAIEISEKSIALNSENIFAFVNLGRAFSNTTHYEKAKGYLNEALRISSQRNDSYMMGVIYTLLANTALLVFDLEASEGYLSKAFEINRQLGPANYCADLILLSRLELMKGNFGKSEANVKEALQITFDLKLLQQRRLCYILLSELAIAQRKYNQYSKYSEERDLLDIAIAQQTVLRSSEEMSAKYETEKKQLEIEQQKNIISRANMQLWLLASSVAVCVVFLVLLWYMLRLRNRRNLALTEKNDALSRLNHALAEMNLTKDKFFSIISHDLKNPAIAQRDAIKMLIRNAGMWDERKLTEYYHHLLKSSEGQVELLFSLLNWSKIQTGRMSYNPVSFNLTPKLHPDLSLIQQMAETKGIEFIADLPECAIVTGDVEMLVTVVRNLLANAVKYTAAGGTVTLDISPCRDTARHVSTNNGYIVSVADTGTGMSREQINKLFCLDTTSSRKGTAGEQGSGLGLIVCKELVEQHETTLNVESEEGKGSKFWFEVKG